MIYPRQMTLVVSTKDTTTNQVTMGRIHKKEAIAREQKQDVKGLKEKIEEKAIALSRIHNHLFPFASKHLLLLRSNCFMYKLEELLILRKGQLYEYPCTIYFQIRERFCFQGKAISLKTL